MSMMDFASALGGGAGGGDVGAGGPPPDLSGGGGAPPDTGAPPDQGAAQFDNSLDALDAAEEALHAFIQLDPDEADRATAARALQVVLQLKSSNQQSAQNGDMKSLARALQGGPGATAGPVGQAAAAAA